VKFEEEGKCGDHPLLLLFAHLNVYWMIIAIVTRSLSLYWLVAQKLFDEMLQRGMKLTLISLIAVFQSVAAQYA
jgi:hypothetical protein